MRKIVISNIVMMGLLFLAMVKLQGDVAKPNVSMPQASQAPQVIAPKAPQALKVIASQAPQAPQALKLIAPQAPQALKLIAPQAPQALKLIAPQAPQAIASQAPIEIYASLINNSNGKEVDLPDLFYVKKIENGKETRQFNLNQGLKQIQIQLDEIMKNLKKSMDEVIASKDKSEDDIQKKKCEELLNLIKRVRTDRKLIKITIEYLLDSSKSKYVFKAGIKKPDSTFNVVHMQSNDKKEIDKLIQKFIDTKKEILDMTENVTKIMASFEIDASKVLQDFKTKTE